ncbi:unnamed protein product [Zymoseptoria tritici ST99CH_1A5]|uniref:Uncharacterized protein n=2 Tax=Zymoseptoria tritici TaxID=1047171 RepID=A0A2H1H9U8_ZYMTR|nr:unnamed protein product [Zymoseptoria tritici ST99CH_1E4]SMR65114.1 unnamed protein product [Zymoseptoria tritici ST99CH_3D1]SMY30517.1 unnamed protein product [Zymoseptoria tritici ST99CH_1A5]
MSDFNVTSPPSSTSPRKGDWWRSTTKDKNIESKRDVDGEGGADLQDLWMKCLRHSMSEARAARPETEMPGSFVIEQSKMLSEETPTPTRTCNCINCHTADKHGHHPAHAFEAATPDMIPPLAAEMKLTAGRNVRHHAICDDCNKNIYGVLGQARSYNSVTAGPRRRISLPPT